MPCVLRLRRCWRLEASNHPYRLLAMPLRALGVVARTRYTSLGGQHFIIAAIPGLSQERCCEMTRAEFSVVWVPRASPLPSCSAPTTSVAPPHTAWLPLTAYRSFAPVSGRCPSSAVRTAFQVPGPVDGETFSERRPWDLAPAVVLTT